MSQDRQNPDRSDTDGLIIRIMGRTKEYKISRMIGETEEELKVRVAEAVNAHPGSLNDKAVIIQPDDIEYIKARSGPFVAQVKESHEYLSVKLCETAEDKLSHKKLRKHRKESTPKPIELQKGLHKGHEGHSDPNTASQTAREPRVGLSRDDREFKPLDLGRGVERNTGEFAWSVFQLAATQLLQNIRGGMYAPETLENVGRITDEIKREITAVQGDVATWRITIRRKGVGTTRGNARGHRGPNGTSRDRS